MFDERFVQYGGGPGYLLVLNSMIFRMPRSLKAEYANLLSAFDRSWNRLPPAWLHGYFIAQWQRK